MRTITGHEPSLWLRNEIDAIRWRTGAGIQRCRHLAGMDKAIIAAWRPDHAWCAGCAAAGVLLDDDILDHTCDRCGRVSRTIRPMMADAGAALIMFGLCRSCYGREVGDDHG